MPVIEKEKNSRKGSACDKATKDTPTGEVGMPYKGKSVGGREIVKKSRGGKGSIHDKATRSTARMEKKFSGRVKKANKRTLWQRCTRRSMPTRTRVVHRGSSSLISNL